MVIKQITTPIKGLNLYLNKVVSDERGSYCDMAPGGTDSPLYSEGIKHIHASIATKRFVARGGHYHFELKESLFNLSGTALWYFYDFDKNSPTFGKSYAVILGYDKLGLDLGIPEYTINKEAAAQIAISPGVYHVFWPLTDGQTVAAGIGSIKYDPEDYDRTKIEDVPGAIEIFEKVKNKILENEKGISRRSVSPSVDTERLLATEYLPIKKAIIPAARSNQQRPFSHTINKHLIPFGNRPMIFYGIENLVAAGVKEIAIVIRENDNLIQRVVGDGSRWKVDIKYIIQKELLGVGNALKISRDFVGDDPFVLYLGDNIILKEDLQKSINKFFEEKSNALLMLAEVDNPQMFGVPEIANGKIIKVEERPMHAKSKFAVAGAYIYDQNAFKAVESLNLSSRGEYEISDVHNYLIDNNYKVSCQRISEWWKDRGNFKDLLNGNRFVLENCVFEKSAGSDCKKIDGFVEKSVKIEGRVKIGKNTRAVGRGLIRGPVVIGEGCLIKDCYIGPGTSIGNNVEIQNAEVENSLIMEQANIFTKNRIVNSVIGRNSSITDKAHSIPYGNEMIMGENCQASI
ncbi:MAG: glucose-1-phosphate thymidylyltransferase [Candidatus Pacebacteria bacterium]|nr:glucose-1-phosphate thymidylyltransferase [Candidatus Paceibacterota bacterium]